MIDVCEAVEESMAKEEYSCYHETYYRDSCYITGASSKVEVSENLKLHHRNSNMKEQDCS